MTLTRFMDQIKRFLHQRDQLVKLPVLDYARAGSQAYELRRFARQLAPSLLLVLAWLTLSLVTFSLVDPYGITGWPIIAGFNDIKPRQHGNQRIYKPLEFLKNEYLLKDDYNGIVLGGSRELRGIDPQSLELRGAGYRVYNFGLSEERIYESEQIADFAINWASIKFILLEIDFTRYNVTPSSIGDLRTYYPKKPILPWGLEQYAREAISLSGLQDIHDTIGASRRHDVVLRQTPDGREEMPAHSPGLDYDYEQKFANVFDAYLNILFPKIAAQSLRWTRNGFDHELLRRIIQLAATHNIRLIAIIPPDHALEMEALRRKGLWPAFERWKQELVCVFHAERAKFRGADFVLWDFSGYNTMTNQPLPRSGAPRRLMDYWDPVHYAIGMGNKILATVLRLKIPEGEINDFGVMLTSANIDGHLEHIQSAQADYEASHAADLRWLAHIDKMGPIELSQPKSLPNSASVCSTTLG